MRKLKNAYKNLGSEATFYDGMIACSTLPGKAVCKLVWNMDKKKNDHYLQLALSGAGRGSGVAMKNKKHLPMMGVGPGYVAVIIAVTVTAVIVGRSAAFEKGRVTFLKIPLFIVGILLIVLGVYLWAGAMFRSKIDSHIVENSLATTGVYAMVRNPIYSAFMFFCTGALMIAGNVFFLPLFFCYWIFMTVLMKCTEEKWLKKLYGREYEEYCSRVNRCIPWLLRSGR